MMPVHIPMLVTRPRRFVLEYGSVVVEAPVGSCVEVHHADAKITLLVKPDGRCVAVPQVPGSVHRQRRIIDPCRYPSLRLCKLHLPTVIGAEYRRGKRALVFLLELF